MKEEGLVENVRVNGEYLGQLLHEYLDSHPFVGNIRGRGFFWSVSASLDKTNSDSMANNITQA